MDKQVFLSKFKTLNKKMDKAQNFISRYFLSDIINLNGCYNHYSKYKHLAFDKIKQDALIYNIECLKITSYNSFNFVVSGKIFVDDECYLLVWTHYNKYKIKIYSI